MRVRQQHGFTLIEVLVAIVILGIGISSVLIAYSGSMKSMREASAYQSAILLAHSKLDETWVDPRLDIKDADDSQEERYNGILYGYKITVRPVPLLEKTLVDKVKMPVELNEIFVQVFWGDEPQRREYRLTAYKLLEVKTPPAAPPATGNAKPAEQVAPTDGAKPAT